MSSRESGNDYSDLIPEIVPGFDKNSWEHELVNKITDLFSQHKLKGLLGEEVTYLLKKMYYQSHGEKLKKINNKDLARALVHIYDSDLLSNREVGRTVIEYFARKLKVKKPSRFVAGRNSAIQFVRSCNLPEELAGQPSISSRYPFVDIHANYKVPNLAEFQDEIKQRLLRFLDRRHQELSCIMSLPTGAGKTRTVVESIHEWIKRATEENQDKALYDLVIWVAQTDELCEQAVQEFKQLWDGKRQEQPTRICRLWGRSNWDTQENRQEIVNSINHNDSNVIIITTNLTLKNIVANPSNNFSHTILDNLDLLVIDEAHHAGAKTYQYVIDVIKGKDAMPVKNEQGNKNLPSINIQHKCKFIGITATPFRSGEDNPTETLQQIFHELVYPLNTLKKSEYGNDADQLYRYLQKKRILAKEKWEELETECKFQFNYQEIKQGNQLIDNESMKNVYEKEMQKFIDSKDKSNRKITIVDRIVNIVKDNKDAQVLYFGVSVNDARLVSMLLRIEGISAQSIDAKTNPKVRERAINDFREGKIRVLCNCKVLTTGFDAPLITHIILGWQTSSDVLLNQMIGRGLRGVEFGGTPLCHIIQVKDDLDLKGTGGWKPRSLRGYFDMWKKGPKTQVSD